MDRRDFVRASGATVALVTGCVGGDSPDGDDGETNATDGGGNGSDGGSNQTETEGEDSGADGQEETGEEEDAEEEGEESESGYEEAGYTRFMYDPEQAGVDADGYVFTHVGADASRELTERVLGTADSAKRIARTEVGDETEVIGDEIEGVEVSVYGQEASFRSSGASLSGGDAPTEPVDNRAGYDIYESDGSVSGINDERLTVIEGPTVDRVRLVAETLEGETPSYAESSEDVSLLTDAAGAGDAVIISGQARVTEQVPESEIPGVESALLSAFSLSEDGGVVSMRYAMVYPDEEGANTAVNPDSLDLDPPEDADVSSDVTPLFVLAGAELSLFVEGVSVSAEDIEVSDQTTDGRVAVLEASVESDALFQD